MLKKSTVTICAALGISLLIMAFIFIMTISFSATPKRQFKGADETIGAIMHDVSIINDKLRLIETDQGRSPRDDGLGEQTDEFTIIASSVLDLKRKYRNNPYVNVVGFAVKLESPSSVSIQFQFK